MDLLQLSPDGDVAVVLTDAGEVPRGHKVAVRDLPSGAEVHKYGQLIGVATQPIRTGEHVHGHNLAMPPRAGRRAVAAHPVRLRRRVLDVIADVASGRPSASEELGPGGEELVPWQLGAVL